MPKNRRNSRGKKSAQKSSSIDNQIQNYAKSAGILSETVRGDLTSKRQNFNIVQSPPRNFLTMPYWIKQSIFQRAGYSSSVSVVTENNFGFTINSLTQFSSLAALFDQYCIYSITLTLEWSDTNSATFAAPNARVVVFTALDYDNAANIGVSGIQGLSTFNESLVTPNNCLIRMVKPCAALAAYTGSFGGFTTARIWCNSSSGGILHYGIRMILDVTPIIVNLDATISIVAGWRNVQ